MNSIKNIENKMADDCNVFRSTGGRCLGQARVCPQTECRYHVLNGAAKKARQRSFPVACALLFSNRDHTLEEVGNFLGITRERVRQIEIVALARLARGLKKAGAIEAADMRAARLKKLLDIARRTPIKRTNDCI